VLVRAVVENIVNASGDPACHLRPKLLELFGHITAKVTNSADIWRLYAELLASSDSLTDTLHERVSVHCCLHNCSYVLFCIIIYWIYYMHTNSFLVSSFLTQHRSVIMFLLIFLLSEVKLSCVVLCMVHR